MAYLIFFSFSVFLLRMQLPTFLCPLHGFPMVAFGFTTPVYGYNHVITFVPFFLLRLGYGIFVLLGCVLTPFSN